MTRLNLGKAHFHYANACSDSGDLEGAIHSYQLAQDAGLMLPEVLNNQACALAGILQFDAAIRIFESARALAPEDKTISSNLSKLLALTQLTTSETPRDLVTEDLDVNFATMPMNTVPLQMAA